MAISSRYDKLIKKYVKEANKRPVKVGGEEVKIPWQLIKAVMLQESRGDTSAVSDADARGLMQVIPTTAREMGADPDKLSDPKVGIRTGVKYFKRLLKYYDGDFDFAISAYNAGMGNVNKGIKKYGRTYALKYTHGDNFATHEAGHKDEGQSQTQAYNRRIRDFYRELTGEDLPGESYYNAVNSLGYKYDKFAANRKGAFDRVDRMPVSEMIAGIGSGDLDPNDLSYLKQMADKRGRTDFVERIDEALNYESNRPGPREDNQVVVRDPTLIDTGSGGRAGKLTDYIYNPNQLGSEQEQLQRLAAVEEYLKTLEEPPRTMVATAPSGTVEFGEPTIRRSGPPVASTPPGVALVSPAGLAEVATATVRQPTPVELPPLEGLPPLNMPSGSALNQYGDFTRAPAVPQPPVVAPVALPEFEGLPPLQKPNVSALQYYGQLPPAPPAPAAPTPVDLPPLQALQPLEMAGVSALDLYGQLPTPPAPPVVDQRTAPAVRKPESAPMAKKKKTDPIMASIASAKAEADALANTQVTPVGEAVQMATQDQIQAAARQSLADKLYRQEYAANLSGAAMSGEEEFLRNAALAQLMNDQSRRQVGFGEAFGGGLVGRDIVLERKQQNQNALQKYRQTVGLGKGGKSRRQLRMDAVAGIAETEARAQEAFTNQLRADMAEYGAKAERALQQQKSRAKGREKKIDLDIKTAELLSKRFDRIVKREGFGTQRRNKDIDLLIATLGKGMSAKEKKTMRTAFTEGGGKEAPYVKRLYDALEQNNKLGVELVKDLNPARWEQSKKQGAEAITDFNAQYNKYIGIMTSQLKTGAHLASLNLGNPYSAREQARGFLAGVVKAKILKDALAGRLPKLYRTTDNDLSNAAEFKLRVGKEFFTEGKSQITAQLQYLNMLAKNDKQLATQGVDPFAEGLRMAEALGGADGENLKRMILNEVTRQGLRYNTKTKTFEENPNAAGTKEKAQNQSIIDTIIKKHGLGLTSSQIRSQQMLPRE